MSGLAIFGMLVTGLWMGQSAWLLGNGAWAAGRELESAFLGLFGMMLAGWLVRFVGCVSRFYGCIWPALSKIESGRVDRLTPREFEEQVAYLLTRGGLPAEVTRYAGDYGVDLVVHRGRQRLAFQAKATARPVGIQAVQQAAAGRRYYDCTGCGVVTSGAFTRSARALAAANECVLIDGAALASMVRAFRRGSRRFARQAVQASQVE